jgi:hypothetical protein
MHPELRHFLADLAGTIALALVPVVLTAFLSMPMTLRYQPGDIAADPHRSLHMT